MVRGCMNGLSHPALTIQTRQYNLENRLALWPLQTMMDVGLLPVGLQMEYYVPPDRQAAKREVRGLAQLRVRSHSWRT